MEDLKAGFEEAFGIEAESAEQPNEQVAETVEEAPQPEPEPKQDNPAAEPETETSEDEPSDQNKEKPRVGLDKYLTEREKRQEAQRRVDDLERRLKEYEAKEAKPQTKVPDPYEDPSGYHAYVQSQIEQSTWQTKAEFSGRLAEQKFGKDTVEAAIAWAQEQGRVDPTLGDRVKSQPSPVEWVVEQYNRDQFYQKYGSDPAKIEALMASQTGQVAPQQQVGIPPAQKTPAPPRSLATAPSKGNGGHQTVPDGSALDSLKFALD